MSELKKIVYYIAVTIIGLGIPFFTFWIINTMVSLKYETENSTGCISLVTGENLCLTINILKGLLLICVITIILLLIYRKRFLNKNTYN